MAGKNDKESSLDLQYKDICYRFVAYLNSLLQTVRHGAYDIAINDYLDVNAPKVSLVEDGKNRLTINGQDVQRTGLVVCAKFNATDVYFVLVTKYSYHDLYAWLISAYCETSGHNLWSSFMTPARRLLPLDEINFELSIRGF